MNNDMEENFVIYKDKKQITLAQARKLDTSPLLFYMPEGGKQNIQNIGFCFALLYYLSSHNLIDSWQYVGPEIQPQKTVKGRVY